MIILERVLNKLRPKSVAAIEDGTLEFSTCVHHLFWYGFSAAMSFVASNGSNALAYIFVGTIQDSNVQAAHGLGYSIGNMLVLTLGYGLVNGMDTLCPLTIGLNYPQGCWTYLFQATSVVTCLIVVLLPIALVSNSFMIYISPNATIAKLASHYLIASLPSLFFMSYFEACRKFLIHHRYIAAHTIIAIASIPVQVFFLWIFVIVLGYGSTGAALGRSCAWFTIFLTTAFYLWHQRETFLWSYYRNHRLSPFYLLSDDSHHNFKQPATTYPNFNHPSKLPIIVDHASQKATPDGIIQNRSKYDNLEQCISKTATPQPSMSSSMSKETLEYSKPPSNENVQNNKIKSPTFIENILLLFKRKDKNISIPNPILSKKEKVTNISTDQHSNTIVSVEGEYLKICHTDKNLSFKWIKSDDNTSPNNSHMFIHNHDKNFENIDSHHQDTNHIDNRLNTKIASKSLSFLTCPAGLRSASQYSIAISSSDTVTKSLSFQPYDSHTSTINNDLSKDHTDPNVTVLRLCSEDEIAMTAPNPSKKALLQFHKHWWQGIPLFLKIALPTTFLCIFEWIAFEVQIIAAGYLDETELSALSSAAILGSLLFFFHLSIGVVANGEVGRAMSSRRPKDSLQFTKASIVTGLISSTIMVALMLSLRTQITHLFTKLPEVQAALYRNLLFTSLVTISDALHAILSGIVKAQNLQWYGCIIDFTCLLGIMNISGFTIAFTTPLKGAGFLIGTNIGLTVCFIAYVIMLFVVLDWKKRSDMLSQKPETHPN